MSDSTSFIDNLILENDRDKHRRYLISESCFCASYVSLSLSSTSDHF